MKRQKIYFNEAQQAWVLNWWKVLHGQIEGEEKSSPYELMGFGRGDRAQIRRCEDVHDLLMQRCVLFFAEKICKLNPEKMLETPSNYEKLAYIAGILVYVKNNLEDQESLAKHLGQNEEDSSNHPKMSENRFKAMMRCTRTSDLFTHWRRALQLNQHQADVIRLANDLFGWQMDLERGQQGHHIRVNDSIRFYWSVDYYESFKGKRSN